MSKRKNVSSIPIRERAAHQDVVAVRRERIATLRNRLFTEREILDALSSPGSPFFMLNPKTKKPYSAGTIHNDLVVLREQAIENASKQFEEYRAYQLAEIREARKVAWGNRDLKSIAKFLELEMKLTGTIDASMSYTFNENNLFISDDGQPKDVTELSDDELLMIASGIVQGEVVK